MKTTHMIAGAALAGLLVIGPVTMTQAHEKPTWPSQLDFPQMTTSFAQASNGASVIHVDLRAQGLSASALGQAINSRETVRGATVSTVAGYTGYALMSSSGSPYGALIKSDPRGATTVVGHTINDSHGRIIILVPKPERPLVLITAAGTDSGLTPQGMMGAADAGALIFAASNKL